MRRNKFYGLAIGVIGVLLFSGKAVMVKLAYDYEVDSVTLLLLRMSFALPIYISLWVFDKSSISEEVSVRHYGYLAFFGFTGYYLASFFDFQGLQFIKASVERLILFVYPTLVLLLSLLFFRKRVLTTQWLGVIISYMGIIIVFSEELTTGESKDFAQGATLVFLSALTYAGYLVGSGWLIPKFGASRFTSLAMIISCLCVFIHYLGTHSDYGILFQMPSEVYLIAVLMAVFATVIPSYLISYSIKSIGASSFSVLGSLGPVSTILLAYFFLGEKLTLIQLLGAPVIVFGIFVAEGRLSVLSKPS